jgi:phosphopantetheinyl transferase
MIPSQAFAHETRCLAVVIGVSAQALPGLLSRHRHWLSPADWQPIERQQHAPTRAAMILARLLLRCLLAAATGRSEASFEIMSDRNGKPHLSDGTIAFNLSHAGDQVAVALAHGAVGVDIEGLDSLCGAAEDAPFCHLDRALSEAERAAVSRLPEAARRLRLLEIWTRKEALIKCDGRGFGLDPAAICTVTGARPAGLDGLVAGSRMIGTGTSFSLVHDGPEGAALLCRLDRFPDGEALHNPGWLAAHSEPLHLQAWPLSLVPARP